MADGERLEECENFEDSTKHRRKVPKGQGGEKLVAEKAKGPQARTNGPEATP
jgi:hypothetical protein